MDRKTIGQQLNTALDVTQTSQRRRSSSNPKGGFRPANPRILPDGRSLTLHRVEEVAVGLRVLHLVEEELDRGELVHRVQELAQDPDLRELVLARDELLAARARPVDVDGREDALLRDAAVEMDFRVAGALELFVDHVVHAGAGIDERGGE